MIILYLQIVDYNIIFFYRDFIIDFLILNFEVLIDIYIHIFIINWFECSKN